MIPNCCIPECPKLGVHPSYDERKAPYCEVHFLEWLRPWQEAKRQAAREARAKEEAEAALVFDELTGEVLPFRGRVPAKKGGNGSRRPAGALSGPGGGGSGPGRRKRVQRTPEEEAEAQRVRAEREAIRAQRDAIWEELFPVLRSPGDPPVVAMNKPTLAGPADGDPRGLVFTMDRLSGTGLPGSRICVARGHYDGMGPRGGEAYDYLKLYTEFRGSGGYRARSPCVTVRAAELRAVAAAFVAEAERLEGGEP